MTTKLLAPNARRITTTCAYCGVGCGIDLSLNSKTTNSPVKQLSGCHSHPANYGRLCVKGSNLLNTVSTDNRLGDAQIDGQTVDVDTATSYVAKQFNHVIEQHGRDAIAFYVSGQLLTEDYYVANKLMKGYIGTGNIDTNSRLCMSSAVAAYKRAFGEDIVPCSYQDIEQCDLFVITGSNMAWTHPVLFQRLERAREINPNLTVVCLDPRKTATSELADIHLALKPATDAGFFNGLLNYLICTNAIDQAFIEQHTNDFSKTVKACKSWTLDTVSEFCQLSQEQLTKVYQLFATTEKVVTFFSMGINQSNTGVDKCNSIINCHLATGKIGKLGMGPFSITGQPNAMGGREVGGLANQLTAHLSIEDKTHRELVQSFWQSPSIASESGLTATAIFEAIKSGKIKAIWIMATNPVVSLPDHQLVKDALEACPLVVVSDCVANNDTMQFADVKLPASAWLEKNGTVTNSERRISRQRSVLAPYANAKQDWQLICDVANKMGFSGFDYQHPQEIFTEFAALSGIAHQDQRKFDISGLSDLSRQQYDQLEPLQWPINQHYPLGCRDVLADQQYSTRNRKANFIAITPIGAQLAEQAQKDFLVNSGRVRDQWHTMTRTGLTEKLFTTQDQPFVAINIDDAKKQGIKNFDLLAIENQYGKVILPAQLDSNQAAGELFVPIHWNQQFASHANVSSLYPIIIDQISGQPQLKQTLASITKVKPAKYIQVYSKQAIQLSFDYWHKLVTKTGYAYQAAQLSDDANKNVQTIQQIKAHYHGSWYSYQTPEQHISLCTIDDCIQCYIVETQKHQALNTAWLDAMMAKQSLSFADIQSLLIGKPSDEFLQGKIVCSCLGVREKQIVNAINKGCNSVEQLSEQLACGTKCGSCKPELKQYVKRLYNRRVNKIQCSELLTST
ncbi:molybdopterin-dependent oxidoreductase [Thalassotalea sp. LPB0316]|uniref:nitrate reductase n=1 Tax=Thalassotalea sp. LPB0316 TaxID=2769490 RepID=UPI0018674B3D|nr:molybdopterin-dependent oxidoreductase [Thalassotalea sp. LPB0316]QOL24870.1 molybdopterin-dependent oxidoreductase [Thalassotalea sp. LPB0316]